MRRTAGGDAPALAAGLIMPRELGRGGEAGQRKLAGSEAREGRKLGGAFARTAQRE